MRAARPKNASSPARIAALIVAATVALWQPPAAPAAAGARDDLSEQADRVQPRGWTLDLDNDLFAFTNQDRDYTAGISVTLGGRDAAGPKALTRALDWLDGRSGFGPKGGGSETIRSFETGLVLFTPQDLAAREPLPDDRPYANLAYLSASRLTYRPGKRIAHQSSLTLGMLGLPIVEQLHRGLHSAFGSQEPKGYRHQIADGGEPTARWAVTRYRLLGTGIYARRPFHLRLGVSGSIGYLTEVGSELELRWGNLRTPWWASTPLVADYAGHPPIRLTADAPHDRGPRYQLSAGINVRARAYNAFLQGQMRSSDVTYSRSRLHDVLVEAWLGVTAVLPNRLSISYTIRRQTAELRAGNGSREFTWAGIAVSRQF